MISWTLPALERKSAQWYAIAATVALTVVVWGAFMEIYMMSFAAIALTALYVYATNNSEETIVTLYDEGVALGSAEYFYGQYSGYSVKYVSRQPFSLYFQPGKSTNIWVLEIELPGDISLGEITNFLDTKITNLGAREMTALESIMSRLKI